MSDDGKDMIKSRLATDEDAATACTLCSCSYCFIFMEAILFRALWQDKVTGKNGSQNQSLAIGILCVCMHGLGWVGLGVTCMVLHLPSESVCSDHHTAAFCRLHPA